jgi:hypothetical protein
MPVPSQTPLPQRTRALTIIVMVMSAFVGMTSVMDAMRLANLSSMPAQISAALGPYDPKMLQKAYELQIALLNGVKEPRMLLLALLAFASTLIFVAAGRMLRPGGMPRESMRKLIVGAGFAAAVVRVADGAQSAAIWRKVMPVVAQALPETMRKVPAGTSLPELMRFISDVTVAAFGAWTLLVAGLFVLVSQHFRSPKIRELVQRSDETLDQG